MLDRHGRDLVYGVGMSLSRAVVTSLLVVGVTSAFAAVPRLAHREVKWRIAGVFGGAGIPAAFGGAAINRLVSPRLLLVGFVALMLLAAWRMLQEDEEVGEVSRNAPHRISSRTFSRLISVQPTYLTVVLDRSAVDRLPAVAARAHRAGARLLIIALACPGTGFTTDPVILRHAAVNALEEMRRLQTVAHQLLRDGGVDYDIVAMPYRSSGVPARREGRITAATNRLARDRGATLLPALVIPNAEQPAAPGRASAGRPAHVVAVLPDSAEAVRVARTAGEHALATHLPLALVVPLLALGDTYDPQEMSSGYTRIREDLAAIAGRVQPALHLLGVSARVCCSPYRTDTTASSSQRNMAAAVEHAARRLRSPTIVVSAAFPALAHLRVPAEILRVVELAVPDMVDIAVAPQQ